jgi:uncharacterized protein with HEPN domain
MQPDIKNDLVYLLIILESIKKINIYSNGFVDANQFYNSNDQKEFNASLLLLSTIGDQSSKTSRELKEKYNHIPWIMIKGFRNRISHDYTGIDIEITFKIISEELDILHESIIKIINDELLTGNFAKDELLAAKESSFYRHIDFNLFKI